MVEDSATITFNVLAPADIKVVPNLTEAIVRLGDWAYIAFEVQKIENFAGEVYFEALNLPAGVEVVYKPQEQHLTVGGEQQQGFMIDFFFPNDVNLLGQHEITVRIWGEHTGA